MPQNAIQRESIHDTCSASPPSISHAINSSYNISVYALGQFLYPISDLVVDHVPDCS